VESTNLGIALIGAISQHHQVGPIVMQLCGPMRIIEAWLRSVMFAPLTPRLLYRTPGQLLLNSTRTSGRGRSRRVP
jgi:hypothetical protein